MKHKNICCNSDTLNFWCPSPCCFCSNFVSLTAFGPKLVLTEGCFVNLVLNYTTAVRSAITWFNTELYLKSSGLPWRHTSKEQHHTVYSWHLLKGLFGHVICILHAVNEPNKLSSCWYEFSLSLILTAASKTWMEHVFFFYVWIYKGVNGRVGAYFSFCIDVLAFQSGFNWKISCCYLVRYVILQQLPINLQCASSWHTNEMLYKFRFVCSMCQTNSSFSFKENIVCNPYFMQILYVGRHGFVLRVRVCNLIGAFSF